MTNGAVWAVGVTVVVLAGSASLAGQGVTTASLPEQAAQGAGVQPPPGTAEQGKQLFRKVGCYQCHGSNGEGVISTFDWASGPRLAPSPMPFRRFAQYVRSAPRAPRIMPPYTTKVLPDQDLADIYAFLLSVPLPPALDSIPLLAPRSLSTVGRRGPEAGR
jgi:mono/diheme cytochrome c family protein